MAKPKNSKPSFSLSQRWSIGLNVAISITCMLSIMAMCNYLSTRHHVRANWSSDTHHQLSSITHKVLQTLTNEVKVTVFFNQDQQLFDEVQDLMDEYRASSRFIRVETVDYNTDPTGTEFIKARFNLTPRMVGDMVIFESAGRSKIVQASDLSDLDLSRLISGESREIKRINFKGEIMFTSAIASVTTGDAPVVYFLDGHNEHDPTVDNAVYGYANLAELMRLSHVEIRKLRLVGTSSIPSDCALLVVAGAISKLDPAEEGKIAEYLEKGGRLFLLMNWKSQTDFNRVLAPWNLEIGNNLVLDRQFSKDGRDLYSTNMLPHEITKPLGNNPVQMVLPRSVTIRDSQLTGPDAPKVTELIQTSEQGEARADFDMKKNEIRPNAFRDKFGAITIAAAVEGAPVPGVIGTTRIIATGDSIFLDNEMIESVANRDFAISAVNWLLDRSHLLGGIAPRPMREYRFQLTRNQLWFVTAILLGVIPGTSLAAGIIVWIRRRH